MPVGGAGSRIGVIGVNRIARSGNKNDIVGTAANRKVGNPEGLAVNCAVRLARKKLGKGSSSDVGGGESVFLRVDAIASEIIVIGGYAGEVRNSNGGRCGLRIVCVAGCGDREGASRGRGIGNRSKGRVGERSTSLGPRDTSVARIAGYIGRETKRLRGCYAAALGGNGYNNGDRRR